MMNTPSPDQWAAHLRAVAAASGDAPMPDATAAQLGGLAAPFLAAVCGRDPGPTPSPVPVGDVGLWWALVDPAVDIHACLPEHDEPSLFPQGLYRTIEVWTEADLCGLHALWVLAQQRGCAGGRDGGRAGARAEGRDGGGRDDLRGLAERVRDWHVGHTQPDNATGRPWALHAFLLSGTFEGRHYAETLLHNAIAAGGGTVEPISALILLDAARHLDAHTNS